MWSQSGAVSPADDSLTSILVRTVVLKAHKIGVEKMARVIITIRVMPEDVDVDLDDLLERIKNSVPEGTDVRANEIVPVAFGLKALRVNLARDESLGGTDDIEEAIGNLESVAQVEVEVVSRIS